MKAILEVKRHLSANGCTIGELFVNGKRFCWTLEDVVRAKGVVVPGKTAIDAGKYSVILNISNRFKKLMPLLSGGTVTGRGIRIHSGNRDADTLGCILVGFEKKPNNMEIYKSREAFEALMRELLQYTTIELTVH
jgi:hypothetical protein